MKISYYFVLRTDFVTDLPKINVCVFVLDNS